MTLKIRILRFLRRLFIICRWHYLVKKCLFPLDAYILWCPTWSKNLWRYLIIMYWPRKAVGEIIPVLLATTMAMPDSRKGVVKSTTASRSALIFKKGNSLKGIDNKTIWRKGLLICLHMFSSQKHTGWEHNGLKL